MSLKKNGKPALLAFIALGVFQNGALAAETRTVNVKTPDKTTTTTTRTSHVRQTRDVQQSRSAHGHTRVDHTSNRLSTIGILGPAAGQTSKLTVLSERADGSHEEHLLITSETTKSDDGHADEHRGQGTGGAGGRGDENRGQGSAEADGRSKSDTKSENRGGRRNRFSRDKQTAKVTPRKHTAKDQFSLSGSGNQGIGDGPSVSVSGDSTPDELKSNIRSFTLHDGTAFSAHHEPVRINTDRGEVRIAGKSVVYVVSHSKSVAIYNIADHKAGDVTVKTPGQKRIVLKSGEQVVLSGKENREFSKANPAPEIASDRLKDLGEDAETKIFNAEFSPTAALDHARRFQELVNSKSQADRALVDHVLKTAAIVLQLRAASP